MVQGKELHQEILLIHHRCKDKLNHTLLDNRYCLGKVITSKIFVINCNLQRLDGPVRFDIPVTDKDLKKASHVGTKEFNRI